MKLLLSFFLISLSFPAFSETKDFSQESLTEYEESKTVSQGKYMGGGIASIFIGWGLGHAIQGRYSERGWIFTAGGALSAVGFIGFLSSKQDALMEAQGLENKEYMEHIVSLSEKDYVFLGAMLIGFGIRIWEIIDVWMIPSNYKIVRESPFQIKPVAFYDSNTNFNYGLSLNYRF